MSSVDLPCTYVLSFGERFPFRFTLIAGIIFDECASSPYLWHLPLPPPRLSSSGQLHLFDALDHLNISTAIGILLSSALQLVVIHVHWDETCILPPSGPWLG